ncbi:amino acid permease [Peribacillus simplex]|uniref:amino acid permease n=1 Tax=Peribacillus simplex TaxID=1478 RepID=UPI0024C179F7|nr:amino acid permease [Peribacillus simplex]WHY97188.1 amino acid permease [Peribacillus simplex]
MQNSKESQLHRGLEERHIALMSLGAAIGVGLFLGSASAIKLAGPAIIISYAIGGLMIYLIMRALGEMAIKNPVAGSFSRYASEFVSPLAGYITGWNYWFVWIATCMAEITAVGIYMQFWFPDTPQWAWALAALAIMTTINFLAVKAYGELEFWFALIKIITIILMIVLGFGMIIFGLGNGGIAVGFGNLIEHGGFFPNGISGVILSFQMVMFAYLGIEMLGVTAGEVKNPEKSLKRAIDTVFYRILLFYVLALTVILSITPWDEMNGENSPFVMMFDKIGIPGAAGIIQFVVLTAALSSCNSGIFSTGRMLFNLAQQGESPKSFERTTKSGVPGVAIIVSAVVLLFGVYLNYMEADKVFTYVTSVATFGALWTWGTILVTQIMSRRKMSQGEKQGLSYKMPLFPFTSYFTLAFLVFVMVVLGFSADTRIALIVGPIWILLLVVLYYVTGLHKRNR